MPEAHGGPPRAAPRFVRVGRRAGPVNSRPMVLASYAFDVTICLIIVFGGIGLLLNGLIIYAVVQALGERKENRQALERPEALGPGAG